MKTNKFKILSFIAGISLLFVSCGEAEVPTPEVDNSIASLVARTGTSLDSLDKALTRTNLTSTFQGGGPYTVFAPTNDAFAALLSQLSYESIDEVPVATLTTILKYHVTNGNVLSTSLSNGQTVNTLLGQTFTVNIDPDSGDVTFDGYSGTGGLYFADWQCSNGVIHVIDGVMVPNLD